MRHTQRATVAGYQVEDLWCFGVLHCWVYPSSGPVLERQFTFSNPSIEAGSSCFDHQWTLAHLSPWVYIPCYSVFFLFRLYTA